MSPVNASESAEGFLGYQAGSYDVTFSLRKGYCLVRHKILSSSRTLGVGIGVGGCVVNFVAARSCCILSSSRTSWLLLFSRFRVISQCC